MSKKVFGFKSQMNVGDQGEQYFVTAYKSLDPKKSVDRAVDFHLNDGTSVELKTDTYPMENTQNFFLETFGDVDAGKLGGPFRAREDKIDFFVYYYIHDKTFFWFKTNELCERIEFIISTEKHKIKSIKNKAWTTHGYALPRSRFEDIQVKMDVLP